REQIVHELVTVSRPLASPNAADGMSAPTPLRRSPFTRFLFPKQRRCYFRTVRLGDLRRDRQRLRDGSNAGWNAGYRPGDFSPRRLLPAVESRLMSTPFRTGTGTAVVLAALALSATSAATQAPSAPARGPDGHPKLDGIWQAFNTANWDIQDHSQRPGPTA